MKPTQATVDAFAKGLGVVVPAAWKDPRERWAWLDGWDCRKRDADNGFTTATHAESVAWEAGYRAAELAR